MKSAYFMAAMPLKTSLRLFLRNGISARYCGRAMFVLQSGLFATLLALRERRICKAEISAARLPDNPLFIVSHWRTGSTLLHRLIAGDPEFIAPSMFQATWPLSFLSSRRFVEPIMKRMVAPERPMDKVRMGMDEPMEDEDALFRMTGLSPLERLIFPKKTGYFLKNDTTFLPEQSRQAEWDRAMLGFTAKLCIGSNRRPVMKNPFNALRIKELVRLFPKAAFIHITRNPLDVVPSTIRMWSITGRDNIMKGSASVPDIEETCEVLERVLVRIRSDLAELSSNRWIEIKYENLALNPIQTVKEVYSRLEIDFSGKAEKGMQNFLAGVSGYEKNRHVLSAEQKSAIMKRMAHYI
jgi:hypothetical protein